MRNADSLASTYTTETQGWLDRRYAATDERGIYIAHQPIYGFRNGPCEPDQLERYSITYQIMKALSSIPFSSLLDIGGSEGYKAAMARELFGVIVRSADLSNEAGQRAHELYGIESDVIDIQKLPYPDRYMDVVLCSETLEHVVNLREATMELLRVAKNAVVITVPRDPEEVIRKNIEERVPHAHIHALDLHSFDFVQELGWRIISCRMNSRWLGVTRAIIEARSRANREGKYPKIVYHAYEHAIPVLRRVLGPWSVKACLVFDDWLANHTKSYQGMCLIFLRPDVRLFEQPRRPISVADIMNFTVPHLRLVRR